MHSLLHRADTFQNPLKHADYGLPYRFETIFKDETRRDRRAWKKKLKLLRRIDEALRTMFQRGEQVRFRRYRPGVLQSQVRYSGITRVKRSLLGITALKLGNGKKLTFTRVPKGDAKFLRSLIERLQEAGVTEGAPVTGHEHLCPHCYAVAEIGQVECEACRGTFKSPRKAGLLSLLFPGGRRLLHGPPEAGRPRVRCRRVLLGRVVPAESGVPDDGDRGGIHRRRIGGLSACAGCGGDVVSGEEGGVSGERGAAGSGVRTAMEGREPAAHAR